MQCSWNELKCICICSISAFGPRQPGVYAILRFLGFQSPSHQPINIFTIFFFFAFGFYVDFDGAWFNCNMQMTFRSKTTCCMYACTYMWRWQGTAETMWLSRAGRRCGCQINWTLTYLASEWNANRNVCKVMQKVSQSASQPAIQKPESQADMVRGVSWLQIVESSRVESRDWTKRKATKFGQRLKWTLDSNSVCAAAAQVLRRDLQLSRDYN